MLYFHKLKCSFYYTELLCVNQTTRLSRKTLNFLYGTVINVIFMLIECTTKLKLSYSSKLGSSHAEKKFVFSLFNPRIIIRHIDSHESNEKLDPDILTKLTKLIDISQSNRFVARIITKTSFCPLVSG